MKLRPWMIVSAAWLVPALLGALNGLMQNWISGDRPFDIRELLFGAGDWLIYAAMTPAVFALAAHVPLVRPHLPRKVFLHLTIAILFGVIWATLGTALRAGLMPENLWGDVSTHFTIWLFITLPFGVAVYLGLVGAEHGIRYFAEARERELAISRLGKQVSESRLAALQARVNPHFLFNTLNTIAVLVRDDNPRAAIGVIERFSGLLRQTLAHEQHEVPLETELELVRDYLEIEKARFSDRLRVELDIDSSLLTATVPTFALQHLVENAIRHGIARRPDAGSVTVAARREGASLRLTVTDDGPGLTQSGRRGGLANTRERLAVLYGATATLTLEDRQGGGVMASLVIPYRMEGRTYD